MAKKSVATFAAGKGGKKMVKCIRMDKSPKTGAYVFVEQKTDPKVRRMVNKILFGHHPFWVYENLVFPRLSHESHLTKFAKFIIFASLKTNHQAYGHF